MPRKTNEETTPLICQKKKSVRVNDAQTTPLICQKKKSVRVNDAHLRWEKIRPDIFRIYIEQKKDLKFTMAAIKERHGFDARSVAIFGSHTTG